MRTPITVGVVGLGARGAALAQAFDETAGAAVRWLCDPSGAAKTRLLRRHPNATFTSSLDPLLADETVDAIVVATPSATHFELAGRALAADKHVLVEQPLALSAVEAQALVDRAEAADRLIAVANPLLLDAGLRKLKEIVALGRLGDVYYVRGTARARPPAAAHEESVVWCLGTDLITALLYLLDDDPVDVAVRADAYARPGTVEVASCWFRFATGITAALELSWLDPRDVRRLAVVGSRRTAVFDDGDASRRLTLFETASASRGAGADHVRHGEIVTPRLAVGDPYRIECERFLAAVRGARDPAAARRAVAAVAIAEDLHHGIGAEAPVPAPHVRLALVRV